MLARTQWDLHGVEIVVENDEGELIDRDKESSGQKTNGLNAEEIWAPALVWGKNVIIYVYIIIYVARQEGEGHTFGQNF